VSQPTEPAAIVLVNLGSPEAPTPRAVRRFLREFLSDRRVVEMAPAIWRPVLEGCVLPIRSRRSAEKYATVWGEDGSPLIAITKAQARALADVLAADPATAGAEVAWAMRYGQPSVPDVLAGLAARGVRRALIVPMYPQYSQTTVGSVLDAVAGHCRSVRDQPELRWIRSFPEHPAYIEAAARRVEEAWAREGRPDFAAGARLLLSFHGIPVAMSEAGDPYNSECEASGALIRARLGLSEDEAPVTFQSKFGPAPWLTPATIDTVHALGRAGAPRVDVFCPGFAADCLETLEEIEQLNRQTYDDARSVHEAEHPGLGSGRFVRIDSLNDSPAFITALADLVRAHLGGWVGA
jgi:ferrochelatase